MSVEDFITLCKAKIREYINTNEQYDIYTIWKDFWTIGASQDSAKILDNQRGIFATTLNNGYFDMTYNGTENKLYMNIFTKTGTQTIVVENDENDEQDQGE